MAQTSPLIIPAENRPRLARLLGGLLALLLLAGFIYPAGAYPIQNLAICAVLLTGALGLVTVGLAGSAGDRSAMLAVLGRLPVLAALAFILWAFARWKLMDIPAPGRDWLISLFWMGMAMVLGAAVAVFSRNQLRDLAPFTLLRRLFMLAAIGFGLLALYQYFIGYEQTLRMIRAQMSGPVLDLQTQALLHALGERRVGGQLGNPNVFAAQIAFLALFCLSAFGRGEPRAWRWAGALGFALSLAALLLTKSRGGLLTFGLACALALLALWSGGRGRSRKAQSAIPLSLILIPLVGLLAWAASAHAEEPGGFFKRFSDVATIRERLYYWEIAGKVWARHLWIGEGPGSFSLFYLTFKSPLARESQYAHSWLFQIGSELGLVGLILILAFWGGSLWNVWLSRRPTGGAEEPVLCQARRTEALWLALGLAVLAFNGLFEFSLQWRPFLVLTGLLAGASAGLATPFPASPGGAQRIRGMLGLALSGAAMILAVTMTPRFHLAEYFRWQGDMLAEEERWPEAAETYGKAIHLISDDPSYYLAQAGALSSAGRGDESWPLLVKAAELNPYSASAHDAQAHWLAARGRLAEAIAQMDEAVKRYPSGIGHRLDRAEMQFQAGQPAKAREDLVYIEKNQLQPWEYQQAPYNKLRARAGLAPVQFPPLEEALRGVLGEPSAAPAGEPCPATNKAAAPSPAARP